MIAWLRSRRRRVDAMMRDLEVAMFGLGAVVDPLELSDEELAEVQRFGFDREPECPGQLVDYGSAYGQVFEHPWPDLGGRLCEVCGPVIREFDA